VVDGLEIASVRLKYAVRFAFNPEENASVMVSSGKAAIRRGTPILLVFGVDAEGAGIVKGGVEGFRFLDKDFTELFFLR
jgi:hypothetical protein